MAETVEVEKQPAQFHVLDEKKRLVAGWASVEILDKQGDIVPIKEMERAMISLMDRGGTVIYGHTNKPVAKILQWDIREHPINKKIKGVHFVVKIFDDYDIDDVIWDKVKKGELNSFSIGATAHSDKRIIKDGEGKTREVGILNELSLLEVSIVEHPANPLAVMDEINYVAKSEDVIEIGKQGAAVSMATVSDSVDVSNDNPNRAGGENLGKKPKNIKQKSDEEERFEYTLEDMMESVTKAKEGTFSFDRKPKKPDNKDKTIVVGVNTNEKTVKAEQESIPWNKQPPTREEMYDNLRRVEGGLSLVATKLDVVIAMSKSKEEGMKDAVAKAVTRLQGAKHTNRTSAHDSIRRKTPEAIRQFVENSRSLRGNMGLHGQKKMDVTGLEMTEAVGHMKSLFAYMPTEEEKMKSAVVKALGVSYEYCRQHPNDTRCKRYSSFSSNKADVEVTNKNMNDAVAESVEKLRGKRRKKKEEQDNYSWVMNQKSVLDAVQKCKDRCNKFPKKDDDKKGD